MSASSRLRLFVAKRGQIVAVVLAIVAVAALSGAWFVYSNPPTETVTEQVNRQTISSEVQTSAVVTGNTSLYERGTRLSDRSAYFLRASPVLTLAVVTKGPTGMEVSHRLVLDFQATRNDAVFWENRTVLVRERHAAPGGSARSTATLNMTEVAAYVERVRTEIGTVGTFRANVGLNVSYGTGRYSGRLEATAPLVLVGGAYWLDADLSPSRTHSETVARRVRGSPDPLTYGGLALVGVIALLGATWIATAHYRGMDIEAIQTDLFHSRYGEWISEGEFPTGTNKKHVRINSLEDLVDIAIDSNKRVVYDPDLNAYAVIDGDLIYYFSTSPHGIDAWLDV